VAVIVRCDNSPGLEDVRAIATRPLVGVALLDFE
jgi:Asp/Glu/hydantoin racemase